MSNARARSLLFGLVLLAAPSLAQQVPAPSEPGSGIEVTPQFIYRFEGNVETNFADGLIADDAQVEEGEGFGLTVSFPVSYWFHVEFLARSQNTELALDSGLFGRPNRIGDLSIQHYHAGALVQWGSGQIQPFVAFSLGLALLDLDLPGADTEQKLSGSLGGGAKIMFSRNVGVRLEGRWFWTNLNDDSYNGGHCNDYDCFQYNDDGIYQGEASVGLLFRF
jgi:hypothetical protein